MRRGSIISTVFVLLLLISARANAQDIPLYSQKLTNSLMYNPAGAGEGFGSITLAHRSSYLGVSGAPRNFFFSAHTPFYNHRFGTGINIYQENVNFINNLYLNGAFAYHILFGEYTILSMGVSAEYTSISFDTGADFRGERDDNLITDPINELDFSFGMNFQHRYFKAGGAINRLSAQFELSNDTSALAEFYSGYIAGLIPVRGGIDILEPTIYIRKFTSEETLDLGLYYTYNNLLTLGASYRKGIGRGFATDESASQIESPGIFNVTTGLRIQEKILVGYSYEMFGSDISSAIGSTHEITLRYDFNNRNYQERFRRDYKNSMNFRRKTLSGSSARKRISKKGPRSLSKRRKRQIRQMSPSKRYQNIKKLKKVKSRKFDTKKRRKKNFKRRQRRSRKQRTGFWLWLFGPKRL